MRLLHVMLSSLPKLRFAHGYKTANYNRTFTPESNIIELSLIEVGDAVRSYPDGRTLDLPTQTLCSVVHDEQYTVTCDQPVHQHFTVGFEADFTYEIIDCADLSLSYFDTKSDGIPLEFYLPETMSITAGESASERLLRRIIRSYTENGGNSDITCAALLFELLSQLNSDCIASTQSPNADSDRMSASSLYIRRAIQYIQDHITTKINVSEIADLLGISTEHLSKQFHIVTGSTVVEYINRLKLGIVKELIVSKNISLREAGEQVGITDVNYLSRLFKRYIGITASEYKILHRTYSMDEIKKADTTITR